MVDSNPNPADTLVGKPRASVVIATFNRPRLLRELLASLASQTLPADQFEVIVVDDGSVPPTTRDLPKTPYALTTAEQDNAGPAAARHAGILVAKGEIIVIVDDDMRPVPRFLEEHVRKHDLGCTLVLGHIVHERPRGASPLYERFHARQLDSFVNAVLRAPKRLHGVNVCTGNVSFRREAYLEVGGFDPSLGRSEDRELGLRLEKAGAHLVFCHEAQTVNQSDIAYSTWWSRNFLYGVYDTKIARKHPDVRIADPWHFFFEVNPISRPLVLLTVAVPSAGRLLSHAAMSTANQLDRAGLERVAIAGATLGYGLEYFRGVRAESGSLGAAIRGLLSHMRSRQDNPCQVEKPGSTVGRGNACAIESRGYLTVDETRVHYVHHKSIGLCRGAVLLMGAMSLERTHAYITWARWSRVLAQAGFDVMRFDYRGVGESEGRFEDATLNTWEQDARACLGHLEGLRGNVPILIHGLRMGALFAARLFAEGKGRAMLLWDPPHDAHSMLGEVLRRKLAADYAERTGDGRKTRAQYIADLEQGRSVEVEGFPWSPALWKSAEGMSLPVPKSSSRARPWRAVHMDGRSKERFLSPDHCVAVRIPKPPFWLESRTLVHDLGDLFAVSLGFVQDSSQGLSPKEGRG